MSDRATHDALLDHHNLEGLIAELVGMGVTTVPIAWQGDWAAGTYDEGDGVSHDGSSYVATTTTTDEPPSADWQLVAAVGDASSTTPLSDVDPLPDGVAADPGLGTDASREDHIHPGKGLWDVEVIKSADESATNTTTLQNDDELLFAVGANETWRFEIEVLYSGTTTCDYKWDLTHPTIGSGWMRYIGTDTTANLIAISTGLKMSGTDEADISLGGNGASNVCTVFIEGMLSTTASGNVQFRFAQNTLQSGTAAVTRIGSRLRARRLA